MTKFISVLAAAFVILVIVFTGSIFEQIPADKIVCIQGVVDGKLHWYTSPGLVLQNFGKVTIYNKQFQYWFSSSTEQGRGADESIKIRFNDGGHANLSGGVTLQMPLDETNLIALHTNYGSQLAIENSLIRPVFEKAIYMTGPLMSSAESYAAKRPFLLSYIEDQATRGVYQTQIKDEKEKDLITGIEKTKSTVKFIEGGDKQILRIEESPLKKFGIIAFGLSINEVKYDVEVEKQINSQQQMIMGVQTAIADSKKAEQTALTAEKNGQAEAAKAKWAQEVIKAKMVTEAQQKLEVAVLEKQTAEQYKLRQILEGQGDAERKKLVMEADGALKQKLEAYVESIKAIADALSKQKLVPDTIFISGGAGANSIASASSATANFMDILTMKAAKDLSLDMTVPVGAMKK